MGDNGQSADWMNNLQTQINDLMRSQGQTRVVNQNGQNINVTTVQGSHGNADITIANIESEVQEDDGDDNYEDVDEGDEMMDMNLDINIDQLLGAVNMDGNDMNLLNLLQNQVFGN